MEKEIHVIINGKKCSLKEEKLNQLNNSNVKIELDEKWYDSHGYVLWEDFIKDHPVNDN